MALVIAISAFEAVNSVGLPECILNLSEAAIYLSVATKSNRVNEAMMTTRDRARTHLISRCLSSSETP